MLCLAERETNPHNHSVCVEGTSRDDQGTLMQVNWPLSRIPRPCATLQMQMVRRSVRRLATSFLVVLSLLFSQLALANYVCPTGDSGESAPAVMEMAPGQPCEGMASDQDQPVLCLQHCTNAPQSFDAVKLPSISLPAVVQVFLIPLVTDAADQQAQAYANEGEAQPPPEPIFLSTLRLRV